MLKVIALFVEEVGQGEIERKEGDWGVTSYVPKANLPQVSF